MRGRRLEASWDESDMELLASTVEGIKEESRKARTRKVRMRALLLLRDGMPIAEVSRQVGRSYRTVQRWVAEYRTAGLVGATQPRRPGNKPRLDQDQIAELVNRWRAGQFPRIRDATAWVRAEWGIEYTDSGLYTLLWRNGIERRHTRRVTRGHKTPKWQVSLKKG